MFSPTFYISWFVILLLLSHVFICLMKRVLWVINRELLIAIIYNLLLSILILTIIIYYYRWLIFKDRARYAFNITLEKYVCVCYSISREIITSQDIKFRNVYIEFINLFFFAQFLLISIKQGFFRDTIIILQIFTLFCKSF